jgi:hypothetical protein
MWYTYVGEDGYVHREMYKKHLIGQQLLDAWDKVRTSEDQREINRFLWQSCQDSLDIIRNQLGVIEVLTQMLDDQDEYILALEEEAIDQYGD